MIALRALNAIKTNKMIVLVLAVFVVYTCVTFGFYWANTLEGNVNNFMLIGDMFGVPADLAARGVQPLYYGEGETGWDGQFYFYMANDLLGQPQTTVHFDAVSYRYQRIGFALFAAIVSQVLLMDWVSPVTYLGAYFFLIAVATVAGAVLLKRINLHPVFILFWSLSVGTQVTLFNGLPDASADAFLIIAVLLLMKKRYVLSAIPFVFAALSREIYVVFPTFILLALFVAAFLRTKEGTEAQIKRQLLGLLKPRRYWALAAPFVAFAGWQIYVTEHFGIRPSEQAGAVTGLPFVAWGQYLWSGLQGNHKYVGEGLANTYETGSLLIFMALLAAVVATALLVFLRAYRQRGQSNAIPSHVVGLCAGFLFLALSYTAFGPTVIMHYTGYIKAVALFLFALPFMLALLRPKLAVTAVVAVFLLASVGWTTAYHLDTRILIDPGPPKLYTGIADVEETRSFECINDYRAKIEVQSYRFQSANPVSELFGRDDRLIAQVRLTNLGTGTFLSTRGFGSTYMSFQWVDGNGNVVLDGVRSAILEPIGAGEAADVTVVSDLPPDIGEMTLQLSPVQEGCAWFYQVAPLEISGSRIEFQG